MAIITTTNTRIPTEGGFAHARRVARFSWPLYLGSGIAVVAGIVIIAVPAVPAALRLLAALACVVIVWFAVASFFAFHWMFDRSELLQGTWLRSVVTETPRRWVEISTALEETTIPLALLFPGSEGESIDVYDPSTMNEPALTRARAGRTAGPQRQIAAIADRSADLVLVMLAAHEIRDGVARGSLFQQLARIVAPSGCVVLVEHLRDAAAFAAFGPGALHFYPRGEWLQRAGSAGFNLVNERAITPFVRVFVLQPK
jgi:hypothetical protein